MKKKTNIFIFKKGLLHFELACSLECGNLFDLLSDRISIYSNFHFSFPRSDKQKRDLTPNETKKKCLQDIHFRFFINLVFFGFAEAAAANLNEVWLESSQAITKVTKVLLCDARGWRLLAGGHSFGLLLLGVLLLGNCFAVRIGGFWRFKVCRCFYRTRVRSLGMLVSDSLTDWLTAV